MKTRPPADTTGPPRFGEPGDAVPARVLMNVWIQFPRPHVVVRRLIRPRRSSPVIIPAMVVAAVVSVVIAVAAAVVVMIVPVIMVVIPMPVIPPVIPPVPAAVIVRIRLVVIPARRVIRVVVIARRVIIRPVDRPQPLARIIPTIKQRNLESTRLRRSDKMSPQKSCPTEDKQFHGLQIVGRETCVFGDAS